MWDNERYGLNHPLHLLMGSSVLSGYFKVSLGQYSIDSGCKSEGMILVNMTVPMKPKSPCDLVDYIDLGCVHSHFIKRAIKYVDEGVCPH